MKYKVFTYQIDLCSPLNCNADHSSECVSWYQYY